MTALALRPTPPTSALPDTSALVLVVEPDPTGPGDWQRLSRLLDDVRALAQQAYPDRTVNAAAIRALPQTRALRAELSAAAQVLDGSTPDLRPVRRTPQVLVDPLSRTITVDGDPLPLTYKEHQLLAFLIRHPGRAFTRRQLLQQVWESDDVAALAGRTVDVHVARLRVKLGASRHRLDTVRGHGYRWTALT